MNKFYLVPNHFGNHTNVANAVAPGIVSFKQNQVAGLGGFFIDSLTNLTLSRAGVRERNTKLVITEAGEA